MKKIKELFDKEIGEGLINWIKLEEKINAAIPLLEGKYTATTPEGKVTEAKLSDSLTFPVLNKRTNIKMCYKIISPRFINGNLYCAGIQIGVYDNIGKPVFFQQPEIF